MARQLAAAMRREGVSKSELARRMRTSRSALDRLLDPANPAMTLSTLERAARALRIDVTIKLKSATRRPRPRGAGSSTRRAQE